MQVNFISLFDAISKISPRMEVSQDEVDSYSDLPGEEDSFGRMLARTPVHQCFQKSRAATALLNALFNTSTALRWFDRALTQSPLQSEDIRKEIRDELVRMANQEQQFKDSVNHARHIPQRWHDNSTDGKNQAAPFLNPPKWPRTRDIGFERNELIALLNKNDIPHNFGDIPSAEEEGPKENIAVQPLTASIPKTDTLSSQKKRRRFRGPLAEVLKMAQEAAKDPEDPQSVWVALITIARRKDPPPPIIGYVENEKLVQWENDKAKTGEAQVQYFCRREMTRRFRKPKKCDCQLASQSHN